SICTWPRCRSDPAARTAGSPPGCLVQFSWTKHLLVMLRDLKSIVKRYDYPRASLTNHENQNAYSRMIYVVKVIIVVHVVDVAVVIVGPFDRPRICKLESVAAKNEFGLSLIYHTRAFHVEVMFTSEAGAKLFFWNVLSALALDRASRVAFGPAIV